MKRQNSRFSILIFIYLLSRATTAILLSKRAVLSDAVSLPRAEGERICLENFDVDVLQQSGGREVEQLVFESRSMRRGTMANTSRRVTARSRITMRS
jgi:hypothetical protein